MNLVDDRSKSISEKLQDVYDFIGGGFLASEAVPSAFAMVHLSKGDVMKCAEYCTNMSGDADTIGAIACGMCGAYQGADVIPTNIKESIEKQNPFSFLSIAEHLIEIRSRQPYFHC